ncbi:MAG: hypothetical protein ACRCZS_08880 [Chroococcidiopsis sp.]
MFPAISELQPQGKKAIAYMRSKGYKIRAWNIVYFEGLDADDLVTVNSDRIDYWNDVRSVITDDGDVILAATATTEPGWYYRLNRMNPKGAAQLAFGQYLDCWRIGKHFTQDALVQCNTLKVFRDKNEDGSRAGDPVDTGLFGINQHTTSSAPDLVGRNSAGCLVGKFPATHAKFMNICRSMGLETFDTSLIPGDDFARFS